MEAVAYDANNLPSLADVASSLASSFELDIAMVNSLFGGRILRLSCLRGKAEIVKCILAALN